MARRESHVSDVLARVFRRGGMQRGLRRAQAVLVWPQVAGSQLNRFTRARAVVEGVLIVEVSDSETAMHLTLQRQRFLDVIRGKFGVREVRDIRFQPGRVEGQKAEPQESGEPQEDVAIDEQQWSRLAGSLGELQLPEGLMSPALQAARSMLEYRAKRKAQGWQECEACEALTPEKGLCSTCQRYSNEPAVTAAARALTVDPGAFTPGLSEEQRSVALLQAIARLEDSARELLPQVIANPELRPQLEAVARRLLQAQLGKGREDLQEDDFLKLPSQVARVLGYWE